MASCRNRSGIGPGCQEQRGRGKGEWKEDVGGEKGRPQGGAGGGVLSWEWKEVMRLRRLAQPRECNGYSINGPAHAGEPEKLTQQDSGLLGGQATASDQGRANTHPAGTQAAAFRAGETL